MRTILVTGASGMIGTKVSSTLLKKGFKVIGTDKKPASLQGREGYSFIQADITDKGKITDILRNNKIDVLIHLALSADNDLGSFISGDEESMSKACDKYLYSTAVKQGVKDILLLSTTQVYAPQKSREPIRETSDVKPSTYYGKMKLASEKALLKDTSKSSVNAVILRTAPIYTSEYTQNLRSKVLDNKDEAAFIYKEGEYGFSFCSLYNLVDFIVAIISTPQGRYDGEYNICDTIRISAKEIIEYERAHQRLGAVVQRNYSGDAIKSAIAAQLKDSKRIKCDYLFLDLSTILNNWSYDNTKAQRFSPFRWKLANTK